MAPLDDSSAPAPDPAGPPLPAAPLVGVLRGVGGDVTEADDAFLALVGYSRAEFEAGGMNWREMTPPEFLHLDEAGMRQAAASGGFTAPYQKQFVRRDGSRVPVLMVCAFLPDAPDKWIGYAVDLSRPAPQRAEADAALPPLREPLPQDFYARLVNELVRERTRILTMLDSTEALVWAVDPACRLLSANQAFQSAQRKVTGRNLEVGDSLLRSEYPVEEQARWREWYARALRGERFTVRTSHPVGDRVRHYDSAFSPIVDPRQGEVAGVSVVAQDVTTSVDTEEALRVSEARFRGLIAASPLGIFLADTGGGLVYANPRLAAIWRLPAAELLGHGYVRHIHPDDAPWVQAGWQAALAVGDELDTEYRLALPGGAERHVRVRIAPVREGDRITGYVGTVDDDTERRDLARRVRQGEKMESLGTLAGGIAHDFNNMLAVVLGYTDLALAAADGQPELQGDLGEIRTAGLRARDLVRQILAFSRRTDREQAPVDLRDVVEEGLRMLRAILPAAVTLDAQLPDGPVMVLGDATTLQQVLVNLCTNAEYAMRATGGGRLAVRLDTEGGAGGAAERAVLTVRDTGHGMSAEVRERLFEPFFTTKPLGEGTGMGLAVVHGIVAAHGGVVEVQSAPGAGATVRVVLPVTDGDAAPAPAAPDGEARGHGRVLLVEDEPALARFAARALTRAGFQVRTCRDGAEALRAFVDAPDAVDVVVSDVAMPGLTGDLLAREVRQARPDVPVILVTGFSHTVTPETARALGAAALLQKPVGGRDLVRAVRAAVEGAARGGR